MTKPTLMVLKGITKSFKNGQESLQVLKGIDLSVDEGDFVAIMGPSGSGKSTIASLITRFYDIDEGEILMDGHDTPFGIREVCNCFLNSLLMFCYIVVVCI